MYFDNLALSNFCYSFFLIFLKNYKIIKLFKLLKIDNKFIINCSR